MERGKEMGGALAQETFQYKFLQYLKSEQEGDNVIKNLFKVNRLDGEKSMMGSTAESVAIRGVKYDSACVSCCSACNEGCKYCETGRVSTEEKLNAKKLNFTSEEIVEQYRATMAIGKSKWQDFGARSPGISFMGKGEPGRNPEAIMEAVATLCNSQEITRANIATVGRLDFFKDFASAYVRAKEKAPGMILPSITISLHSPLSEQREKIARHTKTPPSLEETMSRMIEDYLEPYDQKNEVTPGFRFTLVNFPTGENNYSAKALDELVKLNQFIKEKYNRKISVVVAILNEGEASSKNELQSPNWDIAKKVTDQLSQQGVDARLFGFDDSGEEQQTCTCGRLAQESK